LRSRRNRSPDGHRWAGPSCAQGCVSLPVRSLRVVLVEVLLEGRPQSRASPVQQYALVLLAETKQVADLLGRAPVDVAQPDDEPLALRQLSKGSLDAVAGLEREQPPLWFLPRTRRRGPMARPGLVIGLEAVRIHGHLARVTGGDRGERQRALLPRAMGLGLV